ncbi:hypothetical protein [Micavibrio aeruginosavorus]|uniref:hypothetical protein n=1 Tax=Micavibrio aeruginosavorus TaxID=349221 RepID=UPI003F4ABE5B
MNRFIKIFAITTFATWPFLSIYLSILYQPTLGIPVGLVGAAIAGLAIAHVMDDFLILKERKSGKDGKNLKISPIQNTMMTYNLALPTMYQHCVHALHAMNAKIIKSDMDQGVISARTKMTWESFGEKILISLSSPETGVTIVRIESAPLLATTKTDYGKGKRNIELLTQHLGNLSQA